MRKLFLALVILLVLFPALRFSWLTFEHYFVSVGPKPEFVFDEKADDIQNYGPWVKWIAACTPPYDYWYKEKHIKPWRSYPNSVIGWLFVQPKQLLKTPRKGCPPYSDWVKSDEETPLGYSDLLVQDLSMQNDVRFKIPNTYIPFDWIFANKGVYKTTGFLAGIPVVIKNTDFSPLAIFATGSLQVVQTDHEEYLYPVVLSVSRSSGGCPKILHFGGMCQPLKHHMGLFLYWSDLNLALSIWDIAPKEKTNRAVPLPLHTLPFYKDKKDLLKKHIGGVGYKESLKAQFFHILPPEKEKRNNPYQVIYFTGDILAPDYWAKCQHLKTDDGKQPFVINHLNNGQPLYGGFNACSTRIRITPDIGAQVLFQYRAIGDRTLAEFIEGIRSKLQKYVVNQGD